MKRLFFAVLVPDGAREKIGRELYPELKPFEGGLKTVPLQNLHLTLCFLGNQPEEKILKMAVQLMELRRQKPFEIELWGIGSFNNRVLWIGIKKGKKELDALARITNEKLGLAQEPFSGHLTIARNKNLSKEEWKKLERQMSKKKFSAVFFAKAVHLMESNPKPSGSEYKNALEWALTGA